MQRLVKCCLRAALSSAVLELPAKGSRAPRAACGYGALVQRFTARRYSAAAGDALSFRRQRGRVPIVPAPPCRGVQSRGVCWSLAGHADILRFRLLLATR
jgi:hypothetical protein